jgi:transcriptional regulator with XRE-family HTH domain
VPAPVRRVARPTTPAGDQPQAAIGRRLRTARQVRGLTLDQVAGAAGLTKSFLSRLERDEVSPSVASLVTVCEVVGIRVGQLFEAPATSLVRAGEGRQINFGGSDVRELLLTPGTQDKLQVIRSTIEPGGSGGAELYTLDTDLEFVYVVHGRLRITLTAESVVLATGDAFTFPGREPHTWANDSARERCEVLWALAPAP